jgi:hypothetical protein
MADESSPATISQGLEAPIQIGGTVQQFEAWSGTATFRQNGTETTGQGKVFLDILPVPEFRFEFKPEKQLTLKDSFLNAPLIAR